LRSLAFRGLEPDSTGLVFRFAENTNQGVTGKSVPIVHTPAAFNPTAHQAAPKEDCLSLGRVRRIVEKAVLLVIASEAKQSNLRHSGMVR
jgi:hypothetical protein